MRGGAILQVRRDGVNWDRAVLCWPVAIVQLAIDQEPVNFLGRVEACAVGGRGRIEGHLDPVEAACISFGLGVCVCGHFAADHDVAAA